MHNQKTAYQKAPLISIIGCDGSGKSTLSFDLTEALNKQRPTQSRYLGQGSGNIGRQIRSFKLIGPFLDKIIDKKATKARTKGEKIPGILTAFVIFIFSCIRYCRFLKMGRLREKGIMIVTDRYPQVDVPGFYDGPGLSAAKTSNWLISKLVKWEYKLYDKMSLVKPDLIIRLNVDVDTAFSRKSDHDYHLLKAKVEATPKLTFRGAKIVDVDATLPYKEVYQIALNYAKEYL